MLRNRSSFDKTTISGLVTAVDTRRRVCKVITDDGHMLRNVPWEQTTGDAGRCGESWTPTPFDMVTMSTRTGQIVITGTCSQVWSARVHTNFIGPRRDIDPLDFFHRFNLSPSSKATVRGGNCQEDQIPGDRFLTSESGSLLGVLAGGSIIAKASPGAQIFLSRLDDIVRIVGRNFEVFSDVVKQVDVNDAGALYRYIEYYPNLKDSLEEMPAYREAYGNTAAARGEEFQDSILKYQEVITNEKQRWRRTVSEDGDADEVSISEDEVDSVRSLLQNKKWSVTIQGADGSCLYYGDADAASVFVERDGGYTQLLLGGDGNASLDCTTRLTVTTPYAEVIADNIDLGDSLKRTLESMVLGDTLAKWFSKFMGDYSGHTHTGNLGAPTSPPIAPADFTDVLPSGAAYSTANRTQ